MSPLSFLILLIHMVSFFSLINLAECLSVMVVTQRTYFGFADSLSLPLFYFHVTSPPCFPSSSSPSSFCLLWVSSALVSSSFLTQKVRSFILFSSNKHLALQISLLYVHPTDFDMSFFLHLIQLKILFLFGFYP